MSLQSYQKIQNATEEPRKTEYRLFALVTKSLMDVAESEDIAARNKALHWNRRLWLALQADCADDDNKLSDELRAGIISLAIWVDRHSRMVMKGEGEIETLIDVNRTVMEGLAN
jgi:flagellar protein FlaF